ncbi:MAG: amidohydrolase, partial [Lachnospiraceae bacterium]|nr:amidohydrolase [Lachnospiraceae bacterium]MBQ2250350.1 amidohydrolase [Lachnospiraceae bacterium]
MAMLVRNAKIATMDAANPQAEAAVIVGDFFAYVGTEEGAKRYLAEREEQDVEILDCSGQFLMPGFNDSHMHYLHYA